MIQLLSQAMSYSKNEINYGYENDDNVSLSSNRQRLKNAMTDAQKADKGFFQLEQRVKGRNVLIPVYASGQNGATIRDAITGEKQKGMKVGSYCEDLFFTAIISSGHASLTKKGRREPITLFFESPEQYERYMFTEVPTDVKQAWRTKYFQARSYFDE